MSDKYVQLHPTNAENNIINEDVNIYPIIGPGSFKNFETEGETFEPQKKLIPGSNLKNITVGTQTFSLLGTDSINLNAILLNLLYPVGSVYTSVNDPYDGECPIQHAFGMGTWERITDTFLYAKGDNDELGATGGSKDSVIVSHTHSVTGGTHTHPVTAAPITTKQLLSMRPLLDPNGNRILLFSNIGLSEEDTRNGIIPMNISYNLETSSETFYNRLSTTGITGGKKGDVLNIEATHTHTVTIQEGSGSHTHTVSTEGVSGENKNMPPYLVVMAWKRVA